MNTIDFPDWTIISGDDVKKQAKRDMFYSLDPDLYDAILLVSKAPDIPASVRLGGTIKCCECGEVFPFGSEVLLSGTGSNTLECPLCSSLMEVCHWSTRKLDGPLEEFAHKLTNANWITISPYNKQQNGAIRKLAIKISQVAGTSGLPVTPAEQTS